MLGKDSFCMGFAKGGHRDEIGSDYCLARCIGGADFAAGGSLVDEGNKEAASVVILRQHSSAALQVELARRGRPPKEGPVRSQSRHRGIQRTV